MKVTIKPGLIIFHQPYEWSMIQQRLIDDFGPKITISFVCKRELRFTIRRHKGLEKHDDETWQAMKDEGWHHRYRYQDQIHLDFYSETAKTWFVLKYLNN